MATTRMCVETIKLDYKTVIKYYLVNATALFFSPKFNILTHSYTEFTLTQVIPDINTPFSGLSLNFTSLFSGFSKSYNFRH